MGYLRRHAVVVSNCYDDWLEKAHERASEIFPWVSPISPEHVNGERSFFIPPDGSKEGWEESDAGDVRRDEFIAWLRAQCYEDGSSPLTWVEVQYGDDDLVSKVLRHSDDQLSDTHDKKKEPRR